MSINADFLIKLIGVLDTSKLTLSQVLGIIIPIYNHLTFSQKEEFCKWLAGPPPRGLRATTGVIDDASCMSQEEIDKVVEVWSELPN